MIKKPLYTQLFYSFEHYFPEIIHKRYFPDDNAKRFLDEPREFNRIFGDKVVDILTWCYLHPAYDCTGIGFTYYLADNLFFLNFCKPKRINPRWPNNCPVVINKGIPPILYWEISQYGLQLIIIPLKKYIWAVAVKTASPLVHPVIEYVAQREQNFPGKHAYSYGGFAEEKNRYFFAVKGRENIYAFFSALTIL